LLVGMWRAGAEGRRADEAECVLASGGMMKCENPAKLKGRDGSRPCVMYLRQVSLMSTRVTEGFPEAYLSRQQLHLFAEQMQWLSGCKDVRAKT
jgi:hypothetical protein